MKKLIQILINERFYYAEYLKIIVAIMAVILVTMKVPFAQIFLGYFIGDYIGKIVVGIFSDKIERKNKALIDKEFTELQSKLEKMAKSQEIKQFMERSGYRITPKPPMKAD